jgi:hypothetical protein
MPVIVLRALQALPSNSGTRGESSPNAGSFASSQPPGGQPEAVASRLAAAGVRRDRHPRSRAAVSHSRDDPSRNLTGIESAVCTTAGLRAAAIGASAGRDADRGQRFPATRCLQAAAAP